MLDTALEAGDLLFMPRGWVHQARVETQGSFSTHVTISTHQHWRLAELLEYALSGALAAATEDSANTTLRSTLPPSSLSYVGSFHHTMAPMLHSICPRSTSTSSGDDADVSIHSKLLGHLKKAAALLPRYLDASVMHRAADSLAQDFMTHRLPPFPPNTKLPTPTTASAAFTTSGVCSKSVSPAESGHAAESGQAEQGGQGEVEVADVGTQIELLLWAMKNAQNPKVLESVELRLAAPQCMRVVIAQGPATMAVVMGEEEGPVAEEEEVGVTVYHSLSNDRLSHMRKPAGPVEASNEFQVGGEVDAQPAGKWGKASKGTAATAAIPGVEMMDLAALRGASVTRPQKASAEEKGQEEEETDEFDEEETEEEEEKGCLHFPESFAAPLNALSGSFPYWLHLGHLITPELGEQLGQRDMGIHLTRLVAAGLLHVINAAPRHPPLKRAKMAQLQGRAKTSRKNK